LTRSFAANVDVTVVRISNKAMSPALQLAVEFIEHEIAEQGRKWTSLWSSFHAWTDQPSRQDTAIEEVPKFAFN